MIKIIPTSARMSFKNMNTLHSYQRSFSMNSYGNANANTRRINFKNTKICYPNSRSFSMIPSMDEEKKAKLKSFGYIGIGAIGFYGLSTFVW